MKSAFIISLFSAGFLFYRAAFAQELPLPDDWQSGASLPAGQDSGSFEQQNTAGFQGAAGELRLPKEARARRLLDPNGTRLQDDILTPRSVLYNLRLYYLLIQPQPPIICDTSGNLGHAEHIRLTGIHGYEQATLLGQKNSGIDGHGIKNDDPRGFGFLKAVLYYTTTFPRDNSACSGKSAAHQTSLVRFTDGTWFSPSWQRSLVLP